MGDMNFTDDLAETLAKRELPVLQKEIAELKAEIADFTIALSRFVCQAHQEDPEADFHIHDALGFYCSIAMNALHT